MKSETHSQHKQEKDSAGASRVKTPGASERRTPDTAIGDESQDIECVVTPKPAPQDAHPRSDTNIAEEAGNPAPKVKSKLKYALYVLVVLVVLLVAAVVVLAVMLHNATSQEDSSGPSSNLSTSPDSTGQSLGADVCLEPSCVTAATRMINHMNKAVDPCDDFYEFACGGFLDRDEETNQFAIMQKKITKEVKEIVSSPKKNNEPDYVTNIKNYFKSCVDQEAAKNQVPILDWLKNNKLLESFPLISPGMALGSLDLTKIAVRIAKYGFKPLFKMAPSFDIENSNNMVITIYQGEPKLHLYGFSKLPRNHPHIKGYYEIIMRGYAEELLQGHISKNVTEEDMDAIVKQVTAMVDLEIDIVKSLVSENQMKNPSLYERLTLEEFHNKYRNDHFDFMQFVKDVFAWDKVGVTDVKNDDIVVNRNPQYFKNISQILSKTNKTTVANYMIMQAIIDIKDSAKTLHNLGPIETQCAMKMEPLFGTQLTKQFVNKTADPETRGMATEMVSGLRTAFKELLEENKWMDEKTKKASCEKLEAMHSKIAYPEWALNMTKMANVLKNFTFSPDTYVKNYLTYKEAAALWEYQYLRKPADKDIWATPPTSAAAFYNLNLNEIILPSGILQPPFFSLKYPRYINYGGIGAVIGHEITHGFDTQGRKFDKDGNFKQWWSDAAIEKFDQKTQCIIDQYGEYCVHDVNKTVNGKLTLAENIGDNGGLKQSYRAYRNWVKEHGNEAGLPGLNYTADQLFFISYGQVWCGKLSKADAAYYLDVDDHSPYRYRVIGASANFDEFSKAFNCPATSSMNRSKKCEVW